MGNDLKSFLGRGFLCLLVVFGVLGLTETVFSLDYPTKTITVVAGGDPGSGMDVVTRAIVEEAKKILGREVMVENKPGASHMVALSYVISAKPDGYTLISASDAAFVRSPHLLKLKFDPLAETVPIIMYGTGAHFFLVPADSPFKT
jgi:tripartite-type tricarboxylate transporter receptor subunit TctC